MKEWMKDERSWWVERILGDTGVFGGAFYGPVCCFVASNIAGGAQMKVTLQLRGFRLSCMSIRWNRGAKN